MCDEIKNVKGVNSYIDSHPNVFHYIDPDDTDLLRRVFVKLNKAGRNNNAEKCETENKEYVNANTSQIKAYQRYFKKILPKKKGTKLVAGASRKKQLSNLTQKLAGSVNVYHNKWFELRPEEQTELTNKIIGQYKRNSQPMRVSTHL